jgi:SAM-dependent methyltransferase
MIILLNRILFAFGFNSRNFYYSVKGLPLFCYNFILIKKQLKKSKDFSIKRLYPILGEHLMESGTMRGHYFYQDFIVAQKIYHNNPEKHIDIGSRIDGFVAHVAVFREIEIFDIRMQSSNLKNVKFTLCDLMDKQAINIDYCDSISALHSIEHFGLGRYGDSIDINGHKKALDNIYQTLKKGGIFYFSTPIGDQRIEYNAHRVFSIGYLLELFSEKYELISFSFVNDNGLLFQDAEFTINNINSNFGCNYGCGIFELKKI